jgi:hypothetical protein
VDQDLVAPLLDQVMTWIEDGVDVDTIASRIRRHVPDSPDRVSLIQEVRSRRWPSASSAPWRPLPLPGGN